MKILHVITSLRTGGAEKLMVDLLPRLKEKGIEVELCLFNGHRTPFFDKLASSGIKIIDFGTENSVYNPLNIFRLKKLLKHYDIIHTHNYSPQIFAAIAGLGISKPLVTTEHNTSNRRRSIKGFATIDRWMYRHYKRVICISKKAEDNLRDFIGSQSKKIITINNGIETKTYATATPLLDLKPSEVKAITMVAGFRPQKDQDTLIRSMQFLPDRFHLYLVGDGVRRAECEKLVSETKQGNRVHFLGLRTDVPHILKASDFIVMSSHFEGLSLSSLEGMAAGRPFIASEVDGLREVVKDAGILFEHENPNDLADKIHRLDSDESLYMAVSAKCAQRAAEYDISSMANSYIEMYNSL